MTNFLKPIVVGIGLACMSTLANAAPIALIEAKGDFAIFNSGDALGVSNAAFSASFDPLFDLTQSNNFLIEADISRNDVSISDQEFVVEDVTGAELLFFTLVALFEVNDALDGALARAFGEVLDGDLAQTEIADNVFFGFNADITNFTSSSIAGTFNASLSNFLLGDGLLLINEQGTFTSSLSVSTISAVPIPASLPLLAFTGLSLAALGRFRRI